MDYNYHTHTHRCSHATGTEEEYIKRAIENGIKYMGFSEHIPLVFPDGTETFDRLPFCQTKDYFEIIRALGEKYKDKIDIKIGFEMEYYPEYFDEMINTAKKYGAQYLILGQHFTKPEHPDFEPSSAKTDSIDALKGYVDSVIRAMKAKVFTYVAHPDIFQFIGDADTYKSEMKKLCRASKELDIPLEINFLGIRDGRNYPNEVFWQIAGEEQSPVTFGFDAHDIAAAFDKESIEKAEELVKKYNLNYIGKPKLISIL